MYLKVYKFCQYYVTLQNVCHDRSALHYYSNQYDIINYLIKSYICHCCNYFIRNNIYYLFYIWMFNLHIALLIIKFAIFNFLESTKLLAFIGTHLALFKYIISKNITNWRLVQSPVFTSRIIRKSSLSRIVLQPDNSRDRFPQSWNLTSFTLS